MKPVNMKKKILVCDDDESICEIIKIMLEMNGFDVKLLSSGKAILKKIEQYLPDLILIDIWMPGIDGKEITRLIKKDQQTDNIPIVIISALHKSEISSIVKEIGAQGYLLKPFDMDDLISMVKRYTV